MLSQLPQVQDEVVELRENIFKVSLQLRSRPSLCLVTTCRPCVAKTLTQLFVCSSESSLSEFDTLRMRYFEI